MQDASKRVALITGANKGIGFEVARSLGEAGLTVLLGARDAGRGEEAAKKLRDQGFDARFLHIDVAQSETIKAAAATIGAEFKRLDVLVNNAGIIDRADGPPSTADVGAVRRVFETNFFGALEVTQAMLPLLKASSAGRIVNVSSGLGSLALNADPASPFAAFKIIGYNASKAALNMLTVQLAYELRDAGIKVHSADPGYTATDLNGNSGTQTIEEGARETIRLALLPADAPTGGYSSKDGPVPW
ncbi:SDR family oxidoreductase [Chondromyces apiculatus]|nr:SDR family oxidoreductase [Chondromyces apiculatus]